MRYSRRGCVRIWVPFPDPPLPFLPPSNKPTPSSSLQPARQTQSLFFRLPPEMREAILREAFGDRTLHIDLRSRNSWHSHRTSPGVNPFKPVREGWRRLAPWLDPRPPQIECYGDAKVPAWKWYGCFCHRGKINWRLQYDVAPHGKSFFADGCWRGGNWCCMREAATVPDGYRVGAMGFLLSCKQACSEALRILYSTNIISIESQSLLKGLVRQGLVPGAPRLTGPGVELITSLRVRLDLDLWGCGVMSWRKTEDRALFAEQLDLLPRAFSNLQRLEWVLDPQVYNRMVMPLDELDNADELLLRPLLRASARMPAVELTVSMPDCLFFPISTREQHRPALRQDLLGQQLGDIRMWYPFTEPQGESGPGGGGFWMVYGEDVNVERQYDGTFFGQLMH